LAGDGRPWSESEKNLEKKSSEYIKTTTFSF